MQQPVHRMRLRKDEEMRGKLKEHKGRAAELAWQVFLDASLLTFPCNILREQSSLVIKS